ncbi:hypothetical protein AB9B48_18070 [Kluyvera ascorbata]|uniref:hypothetical protein n=1 Tax=Kluyvera ascorbata TaxID=51288 RepID=UPI00350F7DD9
MNSRKQFEAWIKPLWHLETFKGSDDSLQYRDEVIQGKWEAWQAASKASEQQLAAVVAENAVLHAQTPVAYSYRYAGCETCDGFQDWRWELSKEKPPEWMVETGKVTNLVELFERTEAPAAIANIQAQGVEMLLASLPSHYTARADIESFAAQLRQGAEQ